MVPPEPFVRRDVRYEALTCQPGLSTLGQGLPGCAFMTWHNCCDHSEATSFAEEPPRPGAREEAGRGFGLYFKGWGEGVSPPTSYLVCLYSFGPLIIFRIEKLK